jgi:hypothetical protein
MRIRVSAALAVIAVLALAACGPSDAGASDGTDVTEVIEIEIEVDIFSGVPNPRWTVTGETAAELAALVDAASAGRQSGVPDLDLGFRGFVLRGLDLPDGADQVRVRGTDLVVSKADQAGMTRTDEGHALYTMLRGMAADHLDQAILQTIPENGLKGSS